MTWLKDVLNNGRPLQRKAHELPAPESRTGLPARLKAGIERLSGLSMDGVKVHYNSPRPAQLQALAFAQGADIHLGPSQEAHLPHEAWHVVQQRRGGVQATQRVGEVPVNEDPRLEAEADTMGRRAAALAQGSPEPGVQQVATAPATGMTGPGVAQLMRPHATDVGRQFHIRYPRADSDPIVATYTGPATTAGVHRFHSNSRGNIEVPEAQIDGYRPTVALMHPPQQVRPVEDRLSDRSMVLLSEADLSGAMARQRRDPSILNEMVVTTFEQQPNYPDYAQNRRDLESQGVPILNSFDLQGGQSANRLQQLPHGANIHFQMPRVPRSVRGYSTQQLVQDTLRLPQHLERDDLSISITTPDPTSYGQDKSIHNRFYGLESGKALNETDMTLDEADSDSDLETHGYVHKQSTVDKSAEVASKRKRYRFRSRASRALNVADMPADRFATAFMRTLKAGNRTAVQLYKRYADASAIHAVLAREDARVNLLPNGTLFFRLRGG